ncbi:MAG: hypothetical protein KF745_09930 [Phycisphaeraceae bacterium]|nr:hypothetical protein [Phycisphaeraceae bacterium]
MSRADASTLSRLHERLCPSCGYRGRDLPVASDSHDFECPSCGADLYARPPRSYAEMEGLSGADDCATLLDVEDLAGVSLPGGRRRRSLLRRLWAWFTRR